MRIIIGSRVVEGDIIFHHPAKAEVYEEEEEEEQAEDDEEGSGDNEASERRRGKSAKRPEAKKWKDGVVYFVVDQGMSARVDRV